MSHNYSLWQLNELNMCSNCSCNGIYLETQFATSKKCLLANKPKIKVQKLDILYLGNVLVLLPFAMMDTV